MQLMSSRRHCSGGKYRHSEHLRVNWQCSDVLKLGCSMPLNTYALAVMIRFVAPTLLPVATRLGSRAAFWCSKNTCSGMARNESVVQAVIVFVWLPDLSRQLHESQVSFDVLHQYESFDI